MFSRFFCAARAYQFFTFRGWRCCILMFACLVAFRTFVCFVSVVVVAGAVLSCSVDVVGGFVVSVSWLLLYESFVFLLSPGAFFARFSDSLGYLGRILLGFSMRLSCLPR